MTLSDWMQTYYDLAIGQRVEDVMRETKVDGMKVRHDAQVVNAFAREMIRRQTLAAKFRERRAAA